ncbi:unnamed protein product [Alopecurus aequalis]
MKNGGSSSSAAHAGGLAIAERQKPAPSCVAALFQMLAKKKLFSSSSSKTKLLAPARAQKLSPASGRPPGGGGGGEKTPVAKKRPLLLDSADYARSRNEGHGASRSPTPSQDSNCREMSTPGVVARLMGLSSMPSISHGRSASATDFSEASGHRNECSPSLPGSSGSMATSYQKQREPGKAMDERHEHASQFNADSQALWSGRHHNHKVVSPLKSPRSISSRNKARLIEAAARVLEPGLQSRNRHRQHARLEYPCNGDGAARAASVMHNLPDQFSKEIRDADAPTSGARNVGATSLHSFTSGQWSEENGKKIAAAASRRPSQDLSWQVQTEGNSKVLPVSSSSEKARIKESDEMIFNATADTYQGVRKIQPRNVYRGNVASSPLRQNNLKQNALPIASRTEDPQHIIQRQKHKTREQHVASRGKDFVSLNKSMNSSSSLRSKGKVMDEIRMPHTSAESKNLGTKGNGLRSDSSNKPKLRTASPKCMEKDMIIAKGAGLVSEKPRTASPNYVRNDFLRQAEQRNASRCSDSDIVSFTFSSPMKAIPASLLSENTRGKGSAVLGPRNGACPKRNSHRDYQNISSESELSSRNKIQGTSSMEAAKPVCLINQDELKNRDIPGGRVTPSSSEKANGKVSTPSRYVPVGDRQRGILRSTYADENSASGSPNYASDAQFKNRRRWEDSTPTPPFIARDDVTTMRNSGCAEPNPGQHGAHRLAPDGKLMMHLGELTSTVDLLLANVSSPGPRRQTSPSKTFLLKTSESVLASLTKNSPGSKSAASNPLRSLASELVAECLDSMCARLCDSGYRSFAKLAVVGTEERLAGEVRKEVACFGAMARQDLGDIAAGDVELAVESGMACALHEALQIGAQIERDLVLELVREIGLDMLRGAVN